MCIIVAKPKGVELPPRGILENCFKNNSHGAGIMFNHKGKVIITKGYMTYEEFDRALEVLDKLYCLRNRTCVFHFRISTSGKKDAGNCHPYPITKDVELLRETVLKDVDLAVVHNGIINDYKPKDNTLLNDTQNFIIKVLAPLKVLNKKFYENEEVLEFVSKLAKSKLCLLDKKGSLYMTGKFIEKEGIYYSNETYKKKSSFRISEPLYERGSYRSTYYEQEDETVSYNGYFDFETTLLGDNELARGHDGACYEDYANSDEVKYCYDNEYNLYEIDTRGELSLVAFEVDILIKNT